MSDPDIDEMTCKRTERGWSCEQFTSGLHVKEEEYMNPIAKVFRYFTGSQSPLIKYIIALLIFTGITGVFEMFAVFMNYWGYTIPFGFPLAIISTLGGYALILVGAFAMEVGFGRVSGFITLTVLSIIYMMSAIYVDYYFGIYIIPAIAHHDPPLWFALFGYIARLGVAGLPIFPWAEPPRSDIMFMINGT